MTKNMASAAGRVSEKIIGKAFVGTTTLRTNELAHSVGILDNHEEFFCNKRSSLYVKTVSDGKKYTTFTLGPNVIKLFCP
jgi:hypothetical protein